jgi:hypothetical protein
MFSALLLLLLPLLQTKEKEGKWLCRVGVKEI